MGGGISQGSCRERVKEPWVVTSQDWRMGSRAVRLAAEQTCTSVQPLVHTFRAHKIVKVASLAFRHVINNARDSHIAMDRE